MQSTNTFTLHPRLAADTVLITERALSRVLLMNNKYFPWVILVPQVPDVTEMHQLSASEFALLGDEIRAVSRVMEQIFTPDKINVASLGNVVSQLHVHIIARFSQDPAWPGPVWGHEKAGAGEGLSYNQDSLAKMVEILVERLS